MAGPGMTDRGEILREAVAGYLVRHGMAPERFGREALGDPGLAGDLAAGADVGLATADRVLAWMGEEPFGPALRGEVEAFIAATGAGIFALGEMAADDPSFVIRLRRGFSPRLSVCDRVSAWMESRWGAAGVWWPAEEDAPRVMRLDELAAHVGMSVRDLRRLRILGEEPEDFGAGAGAGPAACRFRPIADAAAADWGAS